jgi:hypothetical protein
MDRRTRTTITTVILITIQTRITAKKIHTEHLDQSANTAILDQTVELATISTILRSNVFSPSSKILMIQIKEEVLKMAEATLVPETPTQAVDKTTLK